MDISKGATRTGGLSKVELHPDKPVVRVTVKGEEGKPDKVYTIQKENCPPYVQNGTFYTRLNSDGTKMYSMVPAKQDVFPLKFKEFYHEKDKEPAPVTKNGKGGNGPYTYQQFTAHFEIVSGPCKGMIVPGYFPYNFQPVTKEVNGKVGEYTLISHPGSSFTKKLIEFLDVTGLLKAEIPWRENLLPGMQKFIARRDPTFSGMVKEGRIETLYSGD